MRLLFLRAAILALVLTAPPAAAEKVLRYAFQIAETGFDPAQINDVYSSIIVAHIYDAPLKLEYLARPYKISPNTAAAMPDVSADGKVWTIRIKPGIYFADDPVFKGKKRELTAQDYVYSLKRHWDPKNKSQQLYLVDGRVPGMDALRKAALAGGKFDYDREVEGVKAIDRYTYRVTFNEPNPNFVYSLASNCNLTCAVAREVIEGYPDRTMEHPVGTNAYRLKEWRRSSRMVLERNPGFREELYNETAPADDPEAQAFAARLHGRRLPMIDRVEVYVIEEVQPRWLAFLNAEHDLIDRVPFEFVNLAAPEGRLAPNLQKRRIQMSRNNEHDLIFAYFGMENPVVGGYTPEKVALRRAISLGIDPDEWIRAVYYGQAIVAQSTVPPNAFGADPDLASPLAEFNPAKAKALLDVYGYVDRDGDGYRELPDGSKLVLEIASVPDSQGKRQDELWRKWMDRIGVRTEFKKNQWPQHLKDSRAGKLMIWNLGWLAGDPDADTFYQILYGISKGQANHSRFDLPAWNALYKQARVLPDSPQRDALYREMDRLFFAYAPLRPIAHRTLTGLAQPWLVGFRRNGLKRELWQYLDIDESALPSPQSRGASAAASPAR
ncbi:MAG TPA: ABC transporter substrate-binding protein [Burkholderiales bacterium]|jgi:ABC-type transport system substrate-binding protein|nr:ABC transporter substrate-binding protein [Burkholderiales bacterium]